MINLTLNQRFWKQHFLLQELAMSDEEFTWFLLYEKQLYRLNKETGRLSLYQAIDIFRDELPQVCYEKIKNREQSGHFDEILKKLKGTFKQDFEEAKRRAKTYCITQLVNELGYTIRMNKINCPFHEDPGASCHIYRNTNSYFCFGCNKGGDVIDFFMSVNNCDFKDAVTYLT